MIGKQASLYRNPHIGPNPTFVDPRFFDDLAESDPHAKALEQFFLTLALCHSVIAEQTQSCGDLSDNAIDYTAESPDEAALVATARDLGFVFLGRQGSTIHTKVKGECKSYDLLHTLEFNSTRKRMSVIIRSHDNSDDKIILLCKGADSIIYDRLDSKNNSDSFEWDNKDQHSLRDTCSAHLDQYASEGLRTLCLAYRIIPADEYSLWQQRYLKASSSIVNREEHIEAVCEEVEKNMTLMGGTAIEDRLQDGVPETIAELAKSGIKLWVLTGDKTETAINIGFSCSLLTADMELLVLKATTRDDTKAQLLEALERTNDSLAGNLALVIDGTTLKYALDCELKDMVLTLGMRSKSVLCCRVSPKQKAQVVQMVKRGLNVMTLAIGDGANDVAMIQEANVGIGISGVEGRQAVMSSDYAIAQFRFLRKLLLVHGRWSYLRTAEMIRGFFFKNIVWTLILFWYQIYCQ
jgi:phospholipid-translocating ATPase